MAGEDPKLPVSVLVPLTIIGVLGVLLRERDLGPHLGVSLATVVLAAALPLAGTAGAVLVGFVSYACDLRQRRLRTRAFNAAMTAAVGAVGALVYLMLGGIRVADSAPAPEVLLIRVGIPLLVAYVTMAAANAVAYGIMSALLRGTGVLDVAWQALRSLGLAYLSHVIIAFLFAVLWGPAGLGPLSALFVLGPLVVAHWSIGRGAVTRREHQETVTTFVAALEQADPDSVGHSVRVADLAQPMGAHLGIIGRDAESLRYAALLHDIGLVAVRPELPMEPHGDEAAYLSGMSAHPSAGVAMLGGMDFLVDALPAIAHHHERWDGRGYPAGLAGPSIPLAARVIAVADAYDALTTDRAGTRLSPQAALAQLRIRAGSQLDPTVVEALADALSREIIAPHPPPLEPSGSTRGLERRYQDHDHPKISDAFAEWQPAEVGR